VIADIRGSYTAKRALVDQWTSMMANTVPDAGRIATGARTIVA
jgi:hypothetical protein